MQDGPELVSIATATADLSKVRTDVRDALGARSVPDPVIDDAQLVATELVTNALEHGAAGEVRVHVRVDDGHVVIETEHGDAADVAAALGRTEAGLPLATALHGRGLVLVAALSAWFERAVDASGTWRNRVGLRLPGEFGGDAGASTADA